MITINALTAADEVIIPVQAQYLPTKGMTHLMKSINMVRNHTNEDLKVTGIVMTLVDGRTNLAREVIDTIRSRYGMHIRIFDTQIPVAVKAAEETAHLPVDGVRLPERRDRLEKLPLIPHTNV
jgi:chromosome partitioning protein